MPERTPGRLVIVSPSSSLIEADNKTSESDESYTYDSTSLTSSIFDYEYENGRRYHAWKAGSYPLPNDEKELDRLDLKHHVMRILCDGHLHAAPLQDPRRILDLGAGTGLWAIEMGEQYPEAEILGVDISATQPHWVPSNVYFDLLDVEGQHWPIPENYFDYIHSRFMIGSISSWKRYIKKAYQHCAPGGYFELLELDCRYRSDDGTLKEDSNLAFWSKAIIEAAAEYNRPIPVYNEIVKYFKMAGFVDVKEVIIKSPTNPWPKDPKLKEAGKYQLACLLEGFEAVSYRLLCQGASWKPDEVDVLCAKMRPEVRDRTVHAYQANVIVVGRKPFHEPTIP